MRDIKRRAAGRLSAAVMGAFLAGPARAQAPGLDLDGIAGAMGRTCVVMGPMCKVSFRRDDLKIAVGKLRIEPALALTNWAAFVKSGDAALTYGDLVLLDEEINPVISRLEEGGVEITALHNHLIHDSPRVMYIHFMGRGREVELAKTLRRALVLTKTPLRSGPSEASPKPETAARIERVFGREGTMEGRVLHIAIPRDGVRVKAMGSGIPGGMGMNTPLNFQLEGDNAAVNGDFLLLASEVNPVVKALRAGGIEVASLHNHMLDEEPRLFFMHFWAYGDAVTLAEGLKRALDAQKK